MSKTPRGGSVGVGTSASSTATVPAVSHQNSFRLFARLPDQVNTKICVFDLYRVPTMKVLTASVAGKLSAKPCKPGMSYQLLLDNRAIVEHVSELRDGDTVVLLQKNIQHSANDKNKENRGTAPEMVGSSAGNNNHASPPAASPNSITKVKLEPDASPTVERNPEASNSNTDTSAAASVADSEIEESPDGKPKAKPRKDTASMVVTTTGRSLEEELSSKHTPNGKKPATAGGDNNSPGGASLDSAKTIAESAVEAAAAEAMNIDADSSSGDESESDGGEDNDSDVEIVKTVKPQQRKAMITKVPIPKRRRSKRLAKDPNEETNNKNEAKRRKRVTINSDKQKPEPEEQEPDIPAAATSRDTISYEPPKYEVGERFFVPFYDGHHYPVNIIAIPHETDKPDECRVRFEHSSLIKIVKIESLLPPTEQLDNQYRYTKSSTSASSVCSYSSRSTRASSKSTDHNKYGKPTSTSKAKLMTKEAADKGVTGIEGRWLVEKNRVVYFCEDDDTPHIIKAKFPRISMGKLLYDNRRLWGKAMKEDSRMNKRSAIVMPKTWNGNAVVATGNTSNPYMIPWDSKGFNSGFEEQEEEEE